MLKKSDIVFGLHFLWNGKGSLFLDNREQLMENSCFFGLFVVVLTTSICYLIHSLPLLHVGEDLLELLVGSCEFLAADVEQLLAALGVGAQVVDAALRVLHLLNDFLEFGHRLGVGHFFVLFHCFVLNYEFHELY